MLLARGKQWFPPSLLERLLLLLSKAMKITAGMSALPVSLCHFSECYVGWRTGGGTGRDEDENITTDSVRPYEVWLMSVK